MTCKSDALLMMLEKPLHVTHVGAWERLFSVTVVHIRSPQAFVLGTGIKKTPEDKSPGVLICHFDTTTWG